MISAIVQKAYKTGLLMGLLFSKNKQKQNEQTPLSKHLPEDEVTFPSSRALAVVNFTSKVPVDDFPYIL